MKGGDVMQTKFCTVIGFAGGLCSWLLGGWDAALQAMTICMTVDYLSGLAVAGLFRHSQKTESGGLSSRVGFQGLLRKGMMLLMVLVAHRLDILMGTGYLRDGVCTAFVANELLSILENAGMMGVPIPVVIRNAIDVLKEKGEHK